MSTYTLNVAGLRETVEVLDGMKKGIDRALRRSIDQGMSEIRRRAVDAVVAETTLRGPRVKKRIVVAKRTKPRDYTASVLLKADPLQLKDFKLAVDSQTGQVKADIGEGGSRVIQGAFWPGRKARKDKGKKKKSGQRWNKKQIFERGPKGVTGRAFYRTVVGAEGDRVGRAPIRFAIVPGVVDIIDSELQRQLDDAPGIIADKFQENYNVELQKFEARRARQ